MVRQFKTQEEIEQKRRAMPTLMRTAYPIDKKLDIYARQSNAKQVIKNKESTAMQTVKLRELALQYGWQEQDTTVYIENKYNKHGELTEALGDASGSLSIDERPGLKTLTRHIETGEVGAVMVWDIDRLFRDEDMIMPPVFVKLCKDYRVLVITPDDEFDFNNPRRDDRKHFLDLAQAAANYNTKHVKGRMQVGKWEKAARGEYFGHSVPAGYMLDEERKFYVPNPLWAPIVAKLFKRYCELDGSLAALYREIYGQMIFPDLSKEIEARIGLVRMARVQGGYTLKNRASLQLLLTNVAYIGHIAYDGRVIKYVHPAIVDEQDFFFAYERIAKTDFDGNLIERPEKIVHDEQHAIRERTEALLAGTRKDGRAVITSSDASVYVMQNTYKNQEASYTIRDIKSFSRDKLAVHVSSIDDLVAAQLFHRVVGHIGVMEHRYEQDEQKITICDNFNAVEALKTTQLTTREYTIAELKQSMVRLDREYRVNFDLMSDKEIHENRAAKVRLMKQLDGIEKKQEQEKQEQEDLQEAKQLVQLGAIPDVWEKWDIEKKRRFIRLVTHDIVLEKAGDNWLKLTIFWQPWMTVDELHVCMMIQDTAFILRRRSGISAWTEEESQIVRDLYPTHNRREILEHLPRRSWTSIRTHANNDLHIIRTYQRSDSNIPHDVSLEDIAFIQEHNLVLAHPEQRVWWLDEEYVPVKMMFTEAEVF